MGVTDRDHSGKVSFMAPGNTTTGGSTLEVVVHALGRFNFGCVWDTKGLQNRGQLETNNVTLNGAEPDIDLKSLVTMFIGIGHARGKLMRICATSGSWTPRASR